MRYESRPLVQRIKQFSATNGSDSFHLKWSIGKLSTTPVRSKPFEAGMFRFTPPTTVDLRWQLEISAPDTDFNIRLKSTKREKCFNDVYMVRVKLHNERTGREQFDESGIFIDKEMPIVWNLPIDKSHQADDEYVLHCYLDIPIDKYAELMEDKDRKFGRGLLSSAMADMFEEMISQVSESENSTSDVVLITKQKGIERRFYCHRNILCARSPVFKTLLGNTKFVEARNRVVQIDDIDTETMEAMLKYIYTAAHFRKSTPKGLIIKVINSAEKYDLPELIEQCGLYLVHVCNADIDRLDLLQCADLFRLGWLKRICLMALSTNMGVLEEDEFRQGMSEGSIDELKAFAAKRIGRTKLVNVSTLNG